MIYIGMLSLFQCHLPMVVVDKVVVAIAKHKYGDLSSYGIITPDIGPFRQKATTGRTPVIDSGFVDKIRSKQIRVGTYGIQVIIHNIFLQQNSSIGNPKQCHCLYFNKKKSHINPFLIL